MTNGLGGEKKQVWWEKVGVVPAATAVLTVLITSVAGYYSQKELLRVETRYGESKENAQVIRESARATFVAIAKIQKLNEERQKLAHGEFDSLPLKTRIEIARETNRLQEEWRKDREAVGADIYFAFRSDSSVFDAWLGTRATLDSAVSCIEREYEAAKSGHSPVHCSPYVKRADSSVIFLRRKLKSSYDAELQRL